MHNVVDFMICLLPYCVKTPLTANCDEISSWGDPILLCRHGEISFCVNSTFCQECQLNVLTSRYGAINTVPHCQQRPIRVPYLHTYCLYTLLGSQLPASFRYVVKSSLKFCGSGSGWILNFLQDPDLEIIISDPGPESIT